MKNSIVPDDLQENDINIDWIITDGGTQTRAEINEDVVADYRLLIEDGVKLPPITVFFDGKKYWLADGFHRLKACKQLGDETITVNMRQGTQRDAVLFSVGANASHGLRRTNADKRRAVETLLRDDEWRGWNNSEIARRCSVSDEFVRRTRPIFQRLEDKNLNNSDHLVTRKGTTYTQSTTNIGKSKSKGKTYKNLTELLTNKEQPEEEEVWEDEPLDSVTTGDANQDDKKLDEQRVTIPELGSLILKCGSQKMLWEIQLKHSPETVLAAIDWLEANNEYVPIYRKWLNENAKDRCWEETDDPATLISRLKACEAALKIARESNNELIANNLKHQGRLRRTRNNRAAQLH